MTTDIGGKAVKGAAWLGSGQLLRQVVAFGTQIVLARMLFPEDYGLFAMVFAATQVAQVFTGFGLSAAIIQQRTRDEVVLATCFWVNLSIGLVIAATLILIAPLLNKYFGRTEIDTLILPLAFNMVFSATLTVPVALMTQELRFKQLTIAQTMGSFSGSAAAITLALLGGGVWALIAQPIAGTVITGIAYFVFSRWRPIRLPRLSSIYGMLGFSSQIFAVNIIDTLGRTMQTFVLGRQLNSHALGLYNFSSGITGTVLFQVSSVIVRVMFPALSNMQDDHERAATAWIKATSTIAMVSFPAMAGIIAVAPDLLPVVFGEQWIPSVAVLQILCVSMAIQSVLTTSGTVLMSFGRSELMLKNAIIRTPAIGIALLIGANYGIEGAAIGYTLVAASSFFALTILACRQLQTTVGRLLTELLPWAIAATSMAACVSIVSDVLNESTAWLRLSLSIMSGIALYVGILLIFFRTHTFVLVNDITSRLKSS